MVLLLLWRDLGMHDYPHDEESIDVFKHKYYDVLHKRCENGVKDPISKSLSVVRPVWFWGTSISSLPIVFLLPHRMTMWPLSSYIYCGAEVSNTYTDSSYKMATSTSHFHVYHVLMKKSSNCLPVTPSRWSMGFWTPVSYKVILSTGKGFVSSKDQTLLVRNGDHMNFSHGWALFVLKRMEGAVVGSQEILTEVLDKLQKYSISEDLVISWDQTGLNLLPAEQCTMEKRNYKESTQEELQIRNITTTFATTFIVWNLCLSTKVSPQVKRFP